MSLKFWLSLGLVFVFAFSAIVWIDGDVVKSDNVEYRKYHEGFKDAVSDTGVYISQFEAQQKTEGIRYSKEKDLAIDMDVLRSFYENVAVRFGVQNQVESVQEIIRHIPVMAIINYDGFQIISLETKDGKLVPVIKDNKPFTFVLDSGDVLYFSLDTKPTLYESYSNRFIQADITELLLYTDLSPITDIESFERNKQLTIINKLQTSMESTVRDYNAVMQNIGFDVNFGIPSDFDDFRFTDIGFLAFMQGYPLSNGKTLTSFSFGTSRVSRGNEYYGVIRADGRHVAYETSCGVPANSFLIEILYGEKEAARKGYFVEPCMN